MDSACYTLFDKFKEYFQFRGEFEHGLISLGFEFDEMHISLNGTITFWEPSHALSTKVAQYIKDQGFSYVRFPDQKTTYDLKEV